MVIYGCYVSSSTYITYMYMCVAKWQVRFDIANYYQVTYLFPLLCPAPLSTCYSTSRSFNFLWNTKCSSVGNTECEKRFRTLIPKIENWFQNGNFVSIPLQDFKGSLLKSNNTWGHPKEGKCRSKGDKPRSICNLSLALNCAQENHTIIFFPFFKHHSPRNSITHDRAHWRTHTDVGVALTAARALSVPRASGASGCTVRVTCSIDREWWWCPCNIW